MSLVSTLAKVAVGIAMAKGVSHLARNGLPGSGGQTGSARGGGGAGHGLEGMMGQILGGGRSSGTGTQSTSGGQGGGLGDLLGGGLGSLMNQLGGARTSGRTGPAPGGLGDLLGSLTGGGGAGLGGLLGGLIGGGAASGGLGSILNRVADRADPEKDGQATIDHPAPEQEMAAALMISAMVQAAKCDGKLDDDERRKLMGHMQDADEDEIKFVNDLLAAPVDVEALVKQVPRGMEEQVYLMSILAINVDDPAEIDYLAKLADALGIDPARATAIEDKAGAQAT